MELQMWAILFVRTLFESQHKSIILQVIFDTDLYKIGCAVNSVLLTIGFATDCKDLDRYFRKIYILLYANLCNCWQKIRASALLLEYFLRKKKCFYRIFRHFL